MVSDFEPSGDQPAAIDELARRIQAGEQNVVLLGATGTGKSATTAWLIERLQRPTLVMAPKDPRRAVGQRVSRLLPHNAVEYFVNLLRLLPTRAYIPQTDTYIEKDSRHQQGGRAAAAQRDQLAADPPRCRGGGDGVGDLRSGYAAGVRRPHDPAAGGESIDRQQLLRRFVQIQYARNDAAFTRGTFRVRGDTVEVFPVYEEHPVRIEMFGDEIERLMTLHPVTGEILTDDPELYIFPATHYVAGPERMGRAIDDIEAELGPDWPSWALRQPAGSAAAAHADRLRHRDDAAGRVLLGHRELLAAISTVGVLGRRRTVCSTTSPRTSCW